MTMTESTAESTRTRSWTGYVGAMIVTALGAVVIPGMTLAGIAEPEARLVVGTVTAVPAGTVAVPISLENDNESLGVSADLDVAFPTDLVEFDPPVNSNCHIAPRLASTHIVAGTIPQPGLLRLAVTDPTGLDPLGEGEIATCDFHVVPGVSTGTAALTVEFVELRGASGDLPVVGVDGAIIIGEATPTPSPTATPTIIDTATATSTPTMMPPTATHTSTAPPTSTSTSTPTTTPPSTATFTPPTVVTNTVTATATISPTSVVTGTATRTVTATATGSRKPTTRRHAEDDGCNIAAGSRTSSGGAFALLLVPALLIWARRRRV
jgi:hypothetical protein